MITLRILFSAVALVPVVINASAAKPANGGAVAPYPFLSSVNRELQCSLSEPPVGDTTECALVSSQDFDVCFGVRGNGARLFAHFPALARAVHSFGIPSAFAGGSSGSITGFLFESLLENPLITDCGDGQCCSDMEQRARISFYLKTFEDVASDSFASAIYILPQTILSRAQEQNIPLRMVSLDNTTRADAMQDLLGVLTEPFGALQSTLVNPALIELLGITSANPIRHALDILRATARGADTAGDPLSVMREYILNFDGVAWILDFVASFWAGLEPTNLEEVQTLLKQCATVDNLEKEYSEISLQQTSNGETCSEFYMRLYQTYLTDRKAYETLIGEDTGFPSRLDVMSGEAKLTTLIVTSVVTGDAMSTVEEGILGYKNLIFDPEFDIDFENDVFFGYYGPEKALSTIASSLPTLFNDAKSQKFFPLGPTSWRQSLTASPAEPTLGNAVPSGMASVLSLGGWPDPVPAQVLQSLGCERVVLINRPFGLGNFSTGVARLLGASEEQIDALYGVENPESGFNVAFEAMNATYCVNWDDLGVDIEALAEEAYGAPLISDEACILSLDVGAAFLEDPPPGCTSVLSEAPPNYQGPGVSGEETGGEQTGGEQGGDQTDPTSGTSHAIHLLALVSAAIACIFFQ